MKFYQYLPLILIFILCLCLGQILPVEAEENTSESSISRQLNDARAHAAKVEGKVYKLKDNLKESSAYTSEIYSESFDWWEYPIRPFYPGNRVEVSGNYFLSKQRILDLVGPYVIEDLLFIKTSAAEAVLAKEPWVERVSIDVGYYSGLIKINIVEEQPWMIVELEDGSWLLSRSKKFVTPLKNIFAADFQYELSELPRFVGIVKKNQKRPGGIDLEGLKTGLEIIEKVEATNKLNFEIDLFEYEAEVGLKIIPRSFKKAQVREILLDNDDFLDIEERLSQFSSVRDDLAAREEIARRVDLRFDGQIIVDKFNQ